MPRPLSVAVLVDLVRSPASGGHVKCWERLAEAMADRDDVDVTVYVLGEHAVEELGRAARFVALPPVLSAHRVTGAVGGVDTTDLAPYHPGLARRLGSHDVWHLTHCFSFASTAVRLAAARHVPLVASVHTDVPALAAVYVDELAGRLPSVLQHPVLASQLNAAVVRTARWRRDRLLRSCESVLVASDADESTIADVVGPARVRRLRRGIDRERFAPPTAHGGHVDGRDELRLLFVGRVDASKRAMLAGQAVRLLREQGLPVRLVVAGRGADEPRLARLLGSGVELLGHVPQQRLSEVYVGCTALVFPSLSETVGNVVAEAMACGLPAVLPAGARTAQWLAAPGCDGVLVPGDDAQDWADALRPLVVDAGVRKQLAAGAAATSARRHPSWSDVVEQDLLPAWRAAAVEG